MNDLERLKENLSEILCSDYLGDTLFYLGEYERLKEYEQAFDLLVDNVWACLDKEQQNNINKKLKKIFKINKVEVV